MPERPHGDAGPRLVLVAAVAENSVIGRDGGLPWHLPADLRHFKRLTMGRPVVMGRRTWEEVGRPLPGRRNVVLTRRPGFVAEGAEVHDSLEAALEALEEAEEVHVIGGAGLYALALVRADRLELTRVHAEPDGDTRFPDWDRSAWRRVASEHHPADERHPHAFTFETWERP